MGLNLIDRSGLELLFFSLSLSISISFYVINFSFSFFLCWGGGGVRFLFDDSMAPPPQGVPLANEVAPGKKKRERDRGPFFIKKNFFFHFWFLFPFPFRLVRCVFFRIFFLPSFTGFKGFYLFFSKERLN